MIAKAAAGLVVIFALIIALAMSAGRVLPQSPQIVYMGENSRLYLYDLQTGYRVQVSEHMGGDSYPASMAWMADRGRISYVDVPFMRQQAGGASGGEIRILNLRDRSVETLRISSTPLSEFRWSPDEGRVAFIERSLMHVHLWEPDGTTRRLTDQAGEYSGLAWSPDGRWLAFGGYEGSAYQLMVIAPESGEKLTVNADSIDRIQPVWAPDGSKLVMSATTEYEEYFYMWDFEELTPIRFMPEQSTLPVWSPDGGQFAFMSFSPQGYTIAMVNADGSDLRPVTNGVGFNTPPVWSPDNKWLAYTGHSEQTYYGLYLQQVDRPDVVPVLIGHVQPGYPYLWR